MSIYRCYVQDYNWKVAKFLIVKNKAHCKRFPIYSGPFSPTTSASACFICMNRALLRRGVSPLQAVFRTLLAYPVKAKDIKNQGQRYHIFLSFQKEMLKNFYFQSIPEVNDKTASK